MVFSFKHVILLIRDSSFLKNILIVMSGSAAAQLLGFALTPVISRLYSPAEFGIFGSFSAMASIIAAGTTLEYSQSILLPKEKEVAFNLFAVSLLSTCLITIICAFTCIISPNRINGLMKTEGSLALALLVFATLAHGINQSFQSWAIRIKAFKTTAASQVLRSITSNTTKIGFGYAHGGALGLIISNIVANLSASLLLIKPMFRDLTSLKKSLRWRLMKKLAYDYRDFPMYSATQNVINNLSLGLPIFLLTRFYGLSVAGAYAFGRTILQVPMSFVLTALRQVLFQKASESYNQGRSLSSLYIKTTATLFAIGLIPSVILFIWAPKLFSWIFGNQWLLAGEFAQALIIWLLISFCNLPAVLFARIIRIQRFAFLYDLVMMFVRLSALILGGIFFTAHHTVLLFALVGAGMNLLLIFYVGRTVYQNEDTFKNQGISIRDINVS